MTTVGVIGCGFVGSALAKFLKQKHTVLTYDVKPIAEWFSLETLMRDCEVIFICVPTPVKDGKYDLSILDSVIAELDVIQRSTENKPLVVIKSTVPPFTTEEYAANTSLRVACNPEFLTEKNADSDMANPDRIVIGADCFDDQKTLEQLYYSTAEPVALDSAGKPLTETPWLFMLSSVEAELVKLLSNAFLVWKVAFSQAAKEICGLNGADAERVLSAVAADKRIGQSHMNPSLGKIPRGSHCLPKDYAGLLGELRGCEDASPSLLALLMLVQRFGLE